MLGGRVVIPSLRFTGSLWQGPVSGMISSLTAGSSSVIFQVELATCGEHT